MTGASNYAPPFSQHHDAAPAGIVRGQKGHRMVLILFLSIWFMIGAMLDAPMGRLLEALDDWRRMRRLPCRRARRYKFN